MRITASLLRAALVILVLLAMTQAAPLQAAASAPATGAYQVEVVIFRTIDAPSGEDLSVPAEGRGFNHQIDTNTTPPAVYRTLEPSQMQLGAVASKLRASGTWKVLAHAGWVQGATDWPKHVGITLDQLGINVSGLSGSVFVERGQFLHLGFDLRLGENPAWSLSELRKVKFNEKNYFDHPGFGVIAIVSPAARPTN